MLTIVCDKENSLWESAWGVCSLLNTQPPMWGFKLAKSQHYRRNKMLSWESWTGDFLTGNLLLVIKLVPRTMKSWANNQARSSLTYSGCLKSQRCSFFIPIFTLVTWSPTDTEWSDPINLRNLNFKNLNLNCLTSPSQHPPLGKMTQYQALSQATSS